MGTRVLTSLRLALVAALLAALLAPLPVFADMGPKPSVVVTVTYQGRPVPDATFQAQMLECFAAGANSSERQKPLLGLEKFDLRDPSGCTWQAGRTLIWGGDCVQGSCEFGYMLPSRFRLAVLLPSQGRLFVSNAVERSGLRADFAADLAADGSATLTPRASPLLERDWTMEGVGLAILLTLAAELAIVLAFVRVTKRPLRRLFIACLIGNLVSVPLVWFFAGFFYIFGAAALGFIGLGIAEVVAWLGEAIFYAWFGRLRVSRALLLSLVANLASFGIGLLVH
jgi:hypothetical protein